MIAFAHGNAGLAALFTNRLDRAQQSFIRELRLATREGRDGPYAALLFEALSGLAAVAAAHGRERDAAT